MATDIIARGMASKAAKAAQEALDELAQVVEGTMNAAETVFTDLNGNVVTPDLTTVYLDTSDYVYYRWNGSAYYTVSDPRGTVKYSVQTPTEAEKNQARMNIGAASCRKGLRTLNATAWDNLEQVITIPYVGEYDYIHVTGSTDADSMKYYAAGIDYSIDPGNGLLFTAITEPSENINLQIVIIGGESL